MDWIAPYQNGSVVSIYISIERVFPLKLFIGVCLFSIGIFYAASSLCLRPTFNDPICIGVDTTSPRTTIPWAEGHGAGSRRDHREG